MRKERKMASEKAIETLRQFIETHATVNASEFYAGVKVPTQREALAAIDAVAAVEGDAQWNAAIEAAARVADDEDQGIAYAGQYNNWAMREDALKECAAAIRSLKRG
jgi:uncharacterized protein with GYD domain